MAGAASLLGVLATLLPLTGCDSTSIVTHEPKPFEGKELTLRCPDAPFADAISPMIKAWEVRTGAKVALVREPMTATDETDIGIIPAGGIGEWAEANLLTPVPAKYRASDHPYQSFGVLPAYGERLIEWERQTLGIPLTGDGFVVVYRADRFGDKAAAEEFKNRFHRTLAVPASWEAFADIALFFAERDKKPSLPPLPADPERFFDLFCRVASSADRRALTDIEVAHRIGRDGDALAFQFTVTTGKPRLKSAFGFQQAAKWLEQIRPALPASPPGGSDDPVAALAQGQPVLAVLSLDQLARLPKENGVVPARFGLGAVPGTWTYFDADKGKHTEANANYIPHFSGGRIGVVRSRCKHAETAFDLLTDLGGPARSAEFVATPGLGAGPLRVAHLDRDRLILWLGYGFDVDRSQKLQDALRQYVGQTVKNPTLGLRGPDRAVLVPAAADPLRKIGTGAKPEDALNQAEEAWNALDAKVPPNKLLSWRKHAAGSN